MERKARIGQGNTAEVYALGEREVLKLFRAGISEAAAPEERRRMWINGSCRWRQPG